MGTKRDRKRVSGFNIRNRRTRKVNGKSHRKETSQWDKNVSKLMLFVLCTALISAVLIRFTQSGGGTQTVTGAVSVPNTCTFVTTNAAVNFGTINAGAHTVGTSGAYNVITVVNTGGNPTNILVSGSNWNFNANQFLVTNTIWTSSNSLISAYAGANSAWNPIGTVSGTSVVSANVEIQLTGTSVDTLQTVSNTLSNTIWFGVNVPALQIGSGSGSYTQTVNIISNC
jgi:hypothetical protein